MTRAAQQGRQLALYVDGVPDPFLVDPIPAKRGRALTELFVQIATGQELALAVSEAIFVEALNPINYSRMTGTYVDEFDAAGNYLRTWSPVGSTVHEGITGQSVARFITREAIPAYGEVELDGEPIREEECQQIALCAFYWQSVVGIEAVNAFLEAGEGMVGSLKALNLLLIRIGRSPSQSSLQAATVSLTQQDDSEGTTDTATWSGSVPLPANRRGFLQNPAKARRKAQRRR